MVASLVLLLPLLTAAACFSARPLCARCERPPSVCYCADLPPTPLRLANSQVLILQHPVESRRKDSTSPLVPLCVDDARIVCGTSFGADVVDSFIHDGYQPLLLFPGPDAQPLERLMDTCEEDKHCNEKVAILLVDGTWRQARQIIRHSPGLVARCSACCTLTAETRSLLEPLRREPAGHCISTAEACAAALRLVERAGRGDVIAAALERATRAMVQRQLSYAPSAPPRVDSRKRAALRTQLRPPPRMALAEAAAGGGGGAAMRATSSRDDTVADGPRVVELDALEFPLARAFYRGQRYRTGAPRRQDRVYVLRAEVPVPDVDGRSSPRSSGSVAAAHGEIVGAVRLSPRTCAELGDLFFLRSVCVASTHRRRGLGTRLVQAALDGIAKEPPSAAAATAACSPAAATPTPCYCFAFADIQGLYAAAGFEALSPRDAPGWLADAHAKVAAQQARRARELVLMVRDWPRRRAVDDTKVAECAVAAMPPGGIRDAACSDDSDGGGGGGAVEAPATAPCRVLVVQHSKELGRPTATAPLLRHPSLAADLSVEVIGWSGRADNANVARRLIKEVAAGGRLVLLWTGGEDLCGPARGAAAASRDVGAPRTPLFIVLDGTWQEARDIFRKGPAQLRESAARRTLRASRPSTYRLRRNFGWRARFGGANPPDRPAGDDPEEEMEVAVEGQQEVEEVEEEVMESTEGTQRAGGNDGLLCTAEAVARLLEAEGRPAAAAWLDDALARFQTAYQEEGAEAARRRILD